MSAGGVKNAPSRFCWGAALKGREAFSNTITHTTPERRGKNPHPNPNPQENHTPPPAQKTPTPPPPPPPPTPQTTTPPTTLSLDIPLEFREVIFERFLEGEEFSFAVTSEMGVTRRGRITKIEETLNTGQTKLARREKGILKILGQETPFEKAAAQEPAEDP